MIHALAAIGLGATLGAWLRWGLAQWLNAALPQMPLGTLAANLIGGYLVGLAVAFFAHYPDITPEWRLFVITGFLGGLTTFSAFSAETVALLMREHYAWGVTLIAAHLCGSIFMTILGLLTYRAIHS